MADPAAVAATTVMATAVAGFTVGKLSAAILAIGALGTASFGLVDGTKSISGGMSRVGFSFIRNLIYSVLTPAGGKTTPLIESILESLKSNWINGVSMGDQELKAKSLILLALEAESAAAFAASLGLDGAAIATLLPKMLTAQAMTATEKDLWGRFDLILTSRLDETYQQADQRYRNWCKALAMLIAIGLACGGYCLAFPDEPFTMQAFWKSFLAGVLAGPLAPIAKDLASSLSAGTKAAQALAE